MRNPFRTGPVEEPVVDEPHPSNDTMNVEKAIEAGHPPVVDVKHPVDDNSSQETFTPDAQDGVKKIEATTTVWSRNNLIAAYIMYVN